MQTVLRKAKASVPRPYPHIIIEDALEETLYQQLVDEFPEEALLKRVSGENKRVDIHAAERDILPPIWKEFVEAHTSTEFWWKVIDVFGEDIKRAYPGIDKKPLDEWTTVIRRAGEADLNMDCQPGINTPQKSVGRVRGPHLDNPIELFGAMLYMGEGEGDLEIGALRKPAEFYGKLEINDDCVKVVGKVKYKPNHFVMFINTPMSIHAVTPRNPTDQCRRMCNFIGEVNYPLFKVGHGRY